jgi:hypothetical protein
MWFLIFSILVIFNPSEQSHFRGGSITARPISHTTTNVTMQFTVTFSWRLSTGPSYFCNETTISSNGLMGPGFETINCRKEGNNLCSHSLMSCDTHCIAFSPFISGSDWSYGRRAFSIEIPQVNYYEASYQSFAWMRLNGGGTEGAMEVRIRLDSRVRQDTGVINTTPITTMPPIIKFRSGIKVTIPLTWADMDQSDDVRCRWADLTLGECGGVCQDAPDPAINQFFTNMNQTVPPATLNSKSCMLTFDGTHPLTVSPGYYAVALQIEDFASTTSTTPLSSVPIQFLIELVNSSSSCSKSCFFTGDRSASGCFATKVGDKYTDRLVAQVGCQLEQITEIQVLGLSGNLQVTSLQTIQGTLEWYVNLTWIPTTDQQGANVICGMATDSAFYVAFHCYTIIVGITEPKAIIIQPSGVLSSTILQGTNNNIEWKIDFDQQITTAQATAYVSIFHSNGTLYTQVDTSDASLAQVNNYTLSFWTTNSFAEGSYYGILDYGVARGVLFCRPSSFPEKNSSFWTFTVTKPTTTLTTTNIISTTIIQTEITNSETNVGAIVGGIVGGCAALAAAAGLVFFLVKRLKKPKINSKNPEDLMILSSEKSQSSLGSITKSRMTPIEEAAAPIREIKPVKTKMMGPLIKNKNFNLPLEDALKDIIANTK